jgi:hypothetical protein
LRREEAGCDRIEFHSSVSSVVAERHISTPWRDPDGLRRAKVDNIKLERGHGRDPSSVALAFNLYVNLWLDRWIRQYYQL